jgi:hypothetical protein
MRQLCGDVNVAVLLSMRFCWVYGLATAVRFVPFCGCSPIVPTGVIQLVYVSAAMLCIVSRALGCAKLLDQTIMTANGCGDVMAGGCVCHAATACSFWAPHSSHLTVWWLEAGEHKRSW